MKKLFIILMICLSLPVLVLRDGLCYETNVHQQITKKAVLSSNVGQYLITNLGIKLSDTFNNKKAQEWLEQGSIWEDDDLTMRWLNHFYDPLTGQGLNKGLATLGPPSLGWAKGEVFPVNNWSWKNARIFYYVGLTETDPTTRNNALASAFLSIGQVMHLVHDLAVPAHVRNDPHGAPIVQFDLYEAYTSNNVSSLPYSGYPAVNIGAFNSIDKFWVNSGNGLAEYTNANFLSRDAMFGSYPSPSLANTNFTNFNSVPISTVTLPDSTTLNALYLSGYGKQHLAQLNYFSADIQGMSIDYKTVEVIS